MAAAAAAVARRASSASCSNDRLLIVVVVAGLLTVGSVAATAGSESSRAEPRAGGGFGGALQAARHLSGKIGSRPAGGSSERRAHAYVARRFEAAGLDVSVPKFRVPGRGRSRNVIGEYDAGPSKAGGECLVILMAHTDSVPPGTGANDNASGVGVLVALAPQVAKLDPGCDVWLVATGAEEREVIGTSYHVGAAALVKTVRKEGRAKDLRFALSADMVGRGKRFYLRSPVSGVRPTVEGQILAAANDARVTVNWERDSGQGNSDHREFELAGLPAAVLEAWRGMDACHHEGCDRATRLHPGALRRAQRILRELIAAE